jgi:hypothetical protein
MAAWERLIPGNCHTSRHILMADLYKWNWGSLFVRPECIGVRPNCDFGRRTLYVP